MKHIFALIILSVLVAACLFVSVVSALPPTALNFAPRTRLAVVRAFPQGWGFFTRNPRDETLNITPLSKNTTEIYWPMINRHNITGFDRTGREEGVEYGVLQSEIPAHSWEYGLDPWKGTHRYVRISNPTRTHILKGKYLVTFSKIVPWAYATGYKSQHITTKYVFINVT